MNFFSKFNFFLLSVIGILLTCTLEEGSVAGQVPVQDSVFSAGAPKGKIQNSQINEASGLAASWSNLGLLWVHNDSGNGAGIFLIAEDGTHVGEYLLEGQENRDWEDIASGPGPEEGKDYLYVGNIGDNNAQYDQIQVLRFEEPRVQKKDAQLSRVIPASEIDVLVMEYPDGPRDAESLLVDPLTRDLYIVTKREDNVRVYKAPYPQSTTETNILEKVGQLPYTWITGGDVSADGQEILLKTYDFVYYWKREMSQSIEEALQAPPVQLPYKREPQGEAIAWKRDGSGFFTTSELFTNPEAILYFYRRLNEE